MSARKHKRLVMSIMNVKKTGFCSRTINSRGVPIFWSFKRRHDAHSPFAHRGDRYDGTARLRANQ